MLSNLKTDGDVHVRFRAESCILPESRIHTEEVLLRTDGFLSESAAREHACGEKASWEKLLPPICATALNCPQRPSRRATERKRCLLFFLSLWLLFSVCSCLLSRESSGDSDRSFVCNPNIQFKTASVYLLKSALGCCE